MSSAPTKSKKADGGGSGSTTGSTTRRARQRQSRRAIALDASKAQQQFADSSRSSDKVVPASASYLVNDELPPPMRSLSPSPPPSRQPPPAPPVEAAHTPRAARIPPVMNRIVKTTAPPPKQPSSPPRLVRDDARAVGWTPQPPLPQTVSPPQTQTVHVPLSRQPANFTSPPSVTVVDEPQTTTINIDTMLSPPLPSLVSQPIQRAHFMPQPPPAARVATATAVRIPPVSTSFRQAVYQPPPKLDTNATRFGQAPPTRQEEEFVLQRKDGVSAPPKRHLYSQYYASLSPDEQAEMRGKFHDRFLILQRSFPEWHIALPAEDSTLDFIHSLYESYVRQINIHASSNYFKMFLIILFIGIELGARAKGIDLSGYAKYQISNMKRYTGVLLELGEKYSTSSQSEWSPEMRMVGIALLQALVFLAAKYAERFTGSALIGEKVRTTLDTFFDSSSSPLSSTDAATVDSAGLPIARGTESAVAALDDPLSSVVADATSKTTQAPAAAPAFDLGGILGGLLGGGGKATGGGDGIVAPIMEAALKFLSNGAGAPAQTASANTSPTVKPSPTATSPTRMSPRNVPRKAPIFPE